MEGYAFKCDICGKVDITPTNLEIYIPPSTRPPDGWVTLQSWNTDAEGRKVISYTAAVCSSYCGVDYLVKMEDPK